MNRTEHKTTPIAALRAYPYWLIYCAAWRRMGGSRRRYPFTLTLGVRRHHGYISLANAIMLWAGKRTGPWEARYPRWAGSRGGSCGHPTAGGRCEIGGLGHHGPHRVDGLAAEWEAKRVRAAS